MQQITKQFALYSRCRGDMNLEKSIRVWASFTVIGFHNWPYAPEEVKYLRSEHRHLFKFSVALKVDGLDRAEEFHTLEARSVALLCAIYKQKIDIIEKGQAIDFKTDSCETIACNLLQLLYEAYKLPLAIEVSEDGEHGAIVELS